MEANFVLRTHHALQQAARRGVSPHELAAAIQFGRAFHRDGLLFKVIGRREVSRHSLPEKLEGLTAVLSSDGTVVVTVYRNHRGIAKLRRKRERSWVRTKKGSRATVVAAADHVARRLPACLVESGRAASRSRIEFLADDAHDLEVAPYAQG